MQPNSRGTSQCASASVPLAPSRWFSGYLANVRGLFRSNPLNFAFPEKCTMYLVVRSTLHTVHILGNVSCFSLHPLQKGREAKYVKRWYGQSRSSTSTCRIFSDSVFLGNLDFIIRSMCNFVCTWSFHRERAIRSPRSPLGAPPTTSTYVV